MFYPRGTLFLHQLLSVTALCFPSLLLALLHFLGIYLLIMFLFLQDLLKILFLYASLLPITIALLNLTPLVAL